MSRIIVRRRQADAARTASDIVVPVTDAKRTARALREILHDAQRDRGRGVWSDADPEVLVDDSVVGRLREQHAIDELVDRVLERVRPSSPRSA